MSELCTDSGVRVKSTDELEVTGGLAVEAS